MERHPCPHGLFSVVLYRQSYARRWGYRLLSVFTISGYFSTDGDQQHGPIPPKIKAWTRCGSKCFRALSIRPSSSLLARIKQRYPPCSTISLLSSHKQMVGQSPLTTVTAVRNP